MLCQRLPLSPRYRRWNQRSPFFRRGAEAAPREVSVKIEVACHRGAAAEPEIFVGTAVAYGCRVERESPPFRGWLLRCKLAGGTVQAVSPFDPALVNMFDLTCGLTWVWRRGGVSGDVVPASLEDHSPRQACRLQDTLFSRLVANAFTSSLSRHTCQDICCGFLPCGPTVDRHSSSVNSGARYA